MLSRCPIRYKLMLGVALLLITVAVLSFGSFRGVYAYRQLAKGISSRATELPLADDLSRRVGDLRVTLSQIPRREDLPSHSSFASGVDGPILREEFRMQFKAAEQALARYRKQLEHVQADAPQIGDNRREQQAAAEIGQGFERIKKMNHDAAWVLDDVKSVAIDEELEKVQRLTTELPGYLRNEMESLARDVRSQYHMWIAQAWISTAMSVVAAIVLMRFFRRWVFRPLDLLVAGSRQVAQGEFDHRIVLDTHDEMAELADALNDMTTRFCEIRDDLDRKVKLRTREALQSEKLASVGFLAAGVAHEINNPLASIAWCAESLESRLHDVLLDYDEDEGEEPDEEMRQEVEVLRKYLRRIQDEAFRCKGITDGLLDYSRMGDVEKQETNLPQLVEGVIDMVRHLGKNREKKIVFACDEPVIAPVNAQEIKQVVLNLVTNALDSLDPGGAVTVDLQTTGGLAELLVTDNGCGMSEDTLKHIFEPFFTRRRDGQGTGLGLSITYRIVTEHGGAIEAVSDGPGHGSQFRVTLPLVKHETKTKERQQAA